MSGKIISVVNQKGGVGKTTTVINIGTAAAASNIKTLIIDLDPQGNASTGMDIGRNQRDRNIYHALIEQCSIKDVIIGTKVPNLHIVPATMDLAASEVELSMQKDKNMRLKSLLSEMIDDYNLIIIDCPPSLGLLSINAMCASSCVLIPLQCEFFAIEGIAHLMSVLKIIQKQLNTDIKVSGILLTMYDRRNNLTLQVEKDIRKHFKDLVYITTIPRNVKISEAQSYGLPAILYDTKCSGSIAYTRLVAEMLTKGDIINNRSE